MNIPIGIIEAILTRLGRLEQIVAQQSAAPETLVPNSYSVDAAGNINTTGVNLPAGTSASPPNQSRVRWIRSDGAVAAQEYGYSATGLEALLLAAFALTSTDISRAILEAVDDVGTAQAQFRVEQTARGSGVALALVSGVDYIVLDGSGTSDFAQTKTKANTATTGAQTLPANPVGFIVTKDRSGSTLKIPYYNP